MKKISFISLILGLLALTSCQEKTTEKKLPRVAIAGIAIESSTFSPAVSREDAFPLRIGDSIFFVLQLFCSRFGCGATRSLVTYVTNSRYARGHC